MLTSHYVASMEVVFQRLHPLLKHCCFLLTPGLGGWVLVFLFGCINYCMFCLIILIVASLGQTTVFFFFYFAFSPYLANPWHFLWIQRPLKVAGSTDLQGSSIVEKDCDPTIICLRAAERARWLCALSRKILCLICFVGEGWQNWHVWCFRKLTKRSMSRFKMSLRPHRKSHAKQEVKESGTNQIHPNPNQVIAAR